ncbi:hypothetical protein A500_16515 [Clostridium sartagoforme AAU1]|uniref:Replication-associated protein ORF2/G2P domain-containing protein n=1 Tax=Clostridium sartagoforme AAU1 TaxID=1202534 RepID=R9BTT9_9CLOT|nr:hypothetical protein [Clostridium sartagoforme]EOR20559.1 hypothetical protein A500_16515 [Clostridium sartagoforme AAU1]
MFIRGKTKKIRKKKHVKTKESLEILKASFYPVYDDVEKSKSRKQKNKQSKKEQKDWNEKNSKEYFFEKAHCNFDTTDYVWHTTFSDEHRPSTVEEAERIFRNLMISINRYRRKIGLERARYMAVIEFGDSGKIHWHILMDGDLHRDILETFWKKGTSNVDRLQQDEEGIRKLCKYMLKDPKGKKRYKCSRGNLEEPPAPTINDNKFTKREMIKMATNPPTKEEIGRWYPGYTLTKFDIKVDDVYGGVYMNIEMRRYVKNENIIYKDVGKVSK